MSYNITFLPSGKSGGAREGENLLKAARRIGVGISSVCGGLGLCGTCRVRLEKGLLSQPTAEEKVHLGEADFGSGTRLACQARIEGDSEVTVLALPEKDGDAPEKPVRAEAADIAPAVKEYLVELEPPTLDDPAADSERLVSGLARGHGLVGLGMSRSVMAALPAALREGSFCVSALVRNYAEVIRVRPGRGHRLLGAAFDIGTTTVAGYLCDLATGELLASDAATNPQAAHGEDVMSRISYAVSVAGGADELRAELLDAVNSMLGRLVKRAGPDAGISGPEEICEAVVVGNTVMHHLLLGLPADNLGVSPFTPSLLRGMDVRAADTGIGIDQGGYVFTLPLIGGFVGADCTAAVLAAGEFPAGEAVLVVDVGTNGELVLSTGGGLYAASCATGPAFEGAQIRYGMRAVPGAIDRVVIDPGTLEADCRVMGGKGAGPGWSRRQGAAVARGICGSGVVDAVARMREAGIIDADGSFVKGLVHERIRYGGKDGAEYVLACSVDAPQGGEITFSQSDVRAVQLAKAALYAGARILMAEAGVESLDRVVLAGAFGSFIDPGSALAIGMFPGVGLDKVSQAGNAAGEGAVAALLSVDKRRKAREIAEKARYVELSAHPGFQAGFLAAMSLP